MELEDVILKLEERRQEGKRANGDCLGSLNYNSISFLFEEERDPLLEQDRERIAKLEAYLKGPLGYYLD